MGTSEEAFHFVDLFAGLGGFHVALEELDGRGVFAAEREPKLKALYKVNFGVETIDQTLDYVTCLGDEIERLVQVH